MRGGPANRRRVPATHAKEGQKYPKIVSLDFAIKFSVVGCGWVGPVELGWAGWRHFSDLRCGVDFSDFNWALCGL